MQKSSVTLVALIGMVVAGTGFQVIAAESIGYKDTPILPGQPWHVHDPDRPLPRVVTPGATFSHNAPPPSDAVVLFDGTDLSKWTSDKGAAGWKVVSEQPAVCAKPEPTPAHGAELLMRRTKIAVAKCCTKAGGYMEVVKGAGNIRTKESFGDFQLHLEFATPEVVVGNSQARGNSGVLIFGEFEVQVLDSYDNRTYADGQAGAMYGQYPPLVNAVKKPGEWQSYDIIFEAPQWGPDGKLTRRASVTVLLNGVALHNKKEYIGRSGHKEVGTYDKLHASRGPIMLQDHGNPMRFRNIWLRNLGEYDKP